MKRMHVHVSVEDLPRFLTTGDSIDYGDGTGEREARLAQAKVCCEPAA